MFNFLNFNVSAIIKFEKGNSKSLFDQVDNLLRQSTSPSEIYILYNEGLDEKDLDKYHYNNFKFVKSSLCLDDVIFPICATCKSEFIFIIKNNFLPSLDWIENCLMKSSVKGCLITENSAPFEEDGVMSVCEYGNKSLFFHKSFLNCYFQEDSPSDESDIFVRFCYLAFAYANKTTYHINVKESIGNENFNKQNLESYKIYKKRGWLT